MVHVPAGCVFQLCHAASTAVAHPCLRNLRAWSVAAFNGVTGKCTRSSSSTYLHNLTQYPARRSAADWDKLTAAVKKEEAEEKPEGEAGLNKVLLPAACCLVPTACSLLAAAARCWLLAAA